MKTMLGVVVGTTFLFAVASGAYAKCGDEPNDAAQVAAARAQVAADCPCDGFPNHGQYVKCARGVAKALADADALAKNCKGAVVSCAARSTCGKPGFVTCCRTDAKGNTRCSTKKDGSKCTAPKGGSACVGLLASCCDACVDGGCAGGSPSGAFVDGFRFGLF